MTTRDTSDLVARLRREFDEILREVQEDPGLGLRLERALARVRRGQRPTARPSRRRPPGPLDPFQLHEEGGAATLRRALGKLEIEQLKDIVAEHGMDRQELAMKWKTPERLVDLIVETVSARAKKGDAFRQS